MIYSRPVCPTGNCRFYCAAVSSKNPAAARLNRDDALRRLKTEGTASLTVRKKMYLEWLKNPSNYPAYQEFNSRTTNPPTGEFFTQAQTGAYTTTPPPRKGFTG